MRKQLLWLAAVAVPIAAVAGADLLDKYSVARDRARASFVEFVRTGNAWLPQPVPGTLRSAAPAARAEFVRALGVFLKSYFNSDAFRADYEREWKQAAPTAPEPARSGKQLAAAQRAEMAKGLAEMRASVDKAPAEYRAQLLASYEQAKAMQAQMPLDEGLLEQMDRQRYESEKAAYDAQLARSPRDPRAALKRAVQQLLDRTAQVDFNAKLEKKWGHERFVSAEFEEKPAEWKLCFRAGRDACEAGRQFLKDWLVELK